MKLQLSVTGQIREHQKKHKNSTVELICFGVGQSGKFNILKKVLTIIVLTKTSKRVSRTKKFDIIAAIFFMPANERVNL